MLLFKPEHVPLILDGAKTQTRRLGERRWKVGSIHKCYTKPPYTKGGSEPFARVEIVDVRQERLLQITQGDALAEGYANVYSFVSAFCRINRNLRAPCAAVACARCDLADPLVWVVTFALVEERP